MCGGAIRIVTCSRVAVRAAQQALRVSDDRDFRHIVELSFGEDVRRVAYRQAGVDSAMSGDESDSLMIRRNYLRRQQADDDECRPFSWYLANVAASDVVRPSTEAQHFGKLRAAGSGLCLGGDSDDGVALVTCREHLYERPLIVELTGRGALVRDGQCLEPTDATVAFAPCEADSPRQRWWMSDGRLTPVTAPRHCLTESADQTHRLAVLRECANADARDAAVNQQWSFINF